MKALITGPAGFIVQVFESSGCNRYLWGGGGDCANYRHVSSGHSQGAVPGEGRLCEQRAVLSASAPARPVAVAAHHVCGLRLSCHLLRHHWSGIPRDFLSHKGYAHQVRLIAHTSLAEPSIELKHIEVNHMVGASSPIIRGSDYVMFACARNAERRAERSRRGENVSSGFLPEIRSPTGVALAAAFVSSMMGSIFEAPMEMFKHRTQVSLP